jgi:uncharacterized protein (UPF0276 family)
MLPRRAGLGFRPEHAHEVLTGAHDGAWFEVHAENYMGAGGPALAMLTELRALYPLSLHGVALSLGGPAARLDRAHLARLRRLIDRFAPASFSEHLAWSTHEGVYFDDLLPLPYTQATLARVCDHIDEAQEALGMRLLLENPTGYLAFPETEMAETDFLRTVVRRTGCGLLLDVANVHASAINLGFDACAYLDAFPLHLVGEIHLAGQAVEIDDEGGRLVIDTHDRPVGREVWDLYAEVIARTGPVPTLIERDAEIPDWSVMVAEAAAVEHVLVTGGAARHACAI